jgi:hypothetical protein
MSSSLLSTLPSFFLSLSLSTHFNGLNLTSLFDANKNNSNSNNNSSFSSCCCFLEIQMRALRSALSCFFSGEEEGKNLWNLLEEKLLNEVSLRNVFSLLSR